MLLEVIILTTSKLRVIYHFTAYFLCAGYTIILQVNIQNSCFSSYTWSNFCNTCISITWIQLSPMIPGAQRTISTTNSTITSQNVSTACLSSTNSCSLSWEKPANFADCNGVTIFKFWLWITSRQYDRAKLKLFLAWLQVKAEKFNRKSQGMFTYAVCIMDYGAFTPFAAVPVFWLTCGFWEIVAVYCLHSCHMFFLSRQRKSVMRQNEGGAKAP